MHTGGRKYGEFWENPPNCGIHCTVWLVRPIIIIISIYAGTGGPDKPEIGADNSNLGKIEEQKR